MLLGPKQVYSQTKLIGGVQNFRGAIVTTVSTQSIRQLTIGITGGTTGLRVEYKTMLRAERVLELSGNDIFVPIPNGSFPFPFPGSAVSYSHSHSRIPTIAKVS